MKILNSAYLALPRTIMRRWMLIKAIAYVQQGLQPENALLATMTNLFRLQPLVSKGLGLLPSSFNIIQAVEPNISPLSCIISIVVGELMVVGFWLEIIPPSLTFGFLPVVPVVGISSLIIFVFAAFGSRKNRETAD